MPFDFFKYDYISINNFDGALHYPFVFDFKGINALLGAHTVDVLLSGVSPLTLLNAVSLNYVKAFGKCEQRNLPSDYVELESLTSSAGTGAYINTGVKATSTVKAEFVCDRPTPPASGTVWQVCSALLDDNGQFAIFESTNAQGGKYIALTYGAVYGSLVYVETSSMTKSTFVIDGGVLTYDNGAKTVTSPQAGTTFTTNNDIWLFSRENASVESLSSVTIYSAKFWDNGVLVRNLVCAKRKSDNKLGMYDLVNDNFIECQGTFTAGADAVLTPETPMNIVSNNGVLKARHQSGLPLGYTLLDYVVFDSTQVIDTGFTPDNNSRIESKCYRTGTNCWFYGASPNTPRVTLFHSDVGTSRWGYQSRSNVGFVADTEYTIVEDKNGLIINGIDNPWNAGTAGDFTCDRSLTIGNNNGSTGTRYFAGNLYYMKIYDNDVLARDFVPCQNASNVVGLYDRVNGVFYTDTGLVAGNPVSDPVEIYTDGTVEMIEDTIGNTATAEMLLKVGDYQDVQSIIDGVVTRNVGVKVLDGTETGWENLTTANCWSISVPNLVGTSETDRTVYCTHFKHSSTMPTANARQGYCLKGHSSANSYIAFGATTQFPTVAQWQQYLADQYTAGTPVIVIYPLATPTTESVAGQTLQVQAGDNVLEITQASIDGLELEAEYEKEAE